MPAAARKRFRIPPSWPAPPSNNATRVSNVGMHGDGRNDHLLWHPVTQPAVRPPTASVPPQPKGEEGASVRPLRSSPAMKPTVPATKGQRFGVRSQHGLTPQVPHLPPYVAVHGGQEVLLPLKGD
jgi:hypothetical protein